MQAFHLVADAAVALTGSKAHTAPKAREHSVLRPSTVEAFELRRRSGMGCEPLFLPCAAPTCFLSSEESN
jgi:hypothetical protein